MKANQADHALECTSHIFIMTFLCWQLSNALYSLSGIYMIIVALYKHIDASSCVVHLHVELIHIDYFGSCLICAPNKITMYTKSAVW